MMKRAMAALVAGSGMLIGIPFSIIGFACQFIRASFQAGQCLAAKLDDWIKRQ